MLKKKLSLTLAKCPREYFLLQNITIKTWARIIEFDLILQIKVEVLNKYSF